MELTTLRGIGLFLSAFLNFFLAFVLWKKSRKNGEIRKDIFHLGLVAFFSGLYAFCSGATYFFWKPDSVYSVLFYKSTWLGVLMLPSYAAFTYYFAGKLNRIKLKIFLLYLAATLICFFALTTSLFVKGVDFRNYNIVGLNGPLDPLGRLFIFYVIIIGISNLFNKYTESEKTVRLQIKYFFAGIIIYSIAGLALTTIIPFSTRTSPYYDVLAYISLIWVALTSYAILRHHLFFSLKVITAEIFSTIISLALLINALLSKTSGEFVLKFLLFLIISFFSILLAKSVLKEVEAKELISKMAGELQKVNIELQKLDRIKTEFMSITSHQLRTPLTAIKGYISMILEGDYGPIPENIKEKMEIVFESNENLIKILNDILNISRVEMGKMKIELKKSSVENIISEVIEEFKMEAEKKNLKIIWFKPKNPLPKINIDENKIKQIITNILDNAIRYTSKGYIEITVENEDSRVIIIKVRDTGEGMTGEEIANLFTSFSRGEAGVQKNLKGSGLGLYIARKFIEMHNGKIRAESEGKNMGSTFYIEIPILLK